MINSRFNPRHAVAGVIALVLMAGAYACTQDLPPTAPVSAVSSVSVSQAAGSEKGSRQTVGGGAESATNRDASSRKLDAMSKVAWIGEVHNDAMTDLTSNLAQWVGTDYDNTARVCRGIANLTMKYVPRTNAHSGRMNSAELNRQYANAAVALVKPECGTHLMSIFATNVLTLSATSARASVNSAQDELSTDYDYHSQRLIAAIEASDGSVSAVAFAGDQVLNSAWGIGQADFEALAAVVTVANSSAVQWNDYASSGGFDGVALVEPMSMFGTAFPWWIVRLVASDAVGCYFGRKAGGSCADGALAASALYLITIL